MKVRSLSSVAACLVAFSLPAVAADWPQWRGPDRTDISRETGLLKTWPQGGPKLLWTYTDAGSGYSGPAVVGNHLFIAGTDDRSDLVLALDTRTGNKLWSTPIGPRFSHGRGSGPRGSPTVDGELLFALGGQGDLACVEGATGKQRWQVNLKRELGGQMMSGWGYSESPLVDGDKVVCTPGGSQGTLAALDKKTGKVLWRSKELTDPAGYSSIVVAEIGGIRQYVQMTGKGVAGVAADDGRLLWRYPKTAYRIAVVPTPIVHDNFVFVSAGYGAGCDLLKLTADGKAFRVEPVYTNKNMVNHHGGVVLVGKYLYGYSDGKGWVCMEFKTGKIAWQERRKLDKGSLTYADGHLYCYGEGQGTVVLVKASPEGWKEDGRFTIPRESKIREPQGKIWTHPVVANGRLYLRDQELIFCYEVKEGSNGSR
jgi:outer membrane protein assembly factor BamB